MRYLDPKNDLVFKKVFGGHANILISFLNAMLPLDDGQTILSIEYLPPELVPDIPIFKNSIVDVRCIDNHERQFIVEMQMLWTDSFKSRVLFNASKAYVRQLDKGVEYKGLKPVYALSLINEIFDRESTSFYHHYLLVHTEDQNKTIDGLELIFVEIPKFRVKNLTDRKLLLLWMRFISEIENGQEMLNEDLLKDLNSVPEIAEALALTMESGYTKAELEAYDKYWDTIRVERTLIADAEAKGEQIGIQKGEQIGIQKGEQIGIQKGEQIGIQKGEQIGIQKGEQIGIQKIKIEMVITLHEDGIPISQIAKYTKLSVDDVMKILKENGKA
jgi:predicted transposase/invertase (TIGR01784 family)